MKRLRFTPHVPQVAKMIIIAAISKQHAAPLLVHHCRRRRQETLTSTAHRHKPFAEIDSAARNGQLESPYVVPWHDGGRNALLLHFWAASFLALLILLASSCSRMPPAPAEASTPTIVWPAPPEPKRIAYVESIRRPSDFGAKQSFLTRLGHSIVGSEKGNESLNKPFGIAFDEEDNLCVTDTGDNVVCFYNRAKRTWRRYEKAGAVRFVSPVAVARRKGIFFVADSALGRIIAFDEAGKLRFQTHDHLERPVGLAISNDQIFITDSLRHCVVVLDLQGKFVREFGSRGTGPGQFNFPSHICCDNHANLLITDSMNSRVQILDPQGVFQSEIGKLGDRSGQFGRPKGVAADAFGRVYALDAVFDNLQIFDSAGHLLLAIGSTGAQPGEFWLPNGIAISRGNEIFVSDSYNHRIQVFRYVGAE
jgi:hypothetical protein